MLEEAAEVLGVKAEFFQEFEVEDPLHGHRLRGGSRAS